MNAGEIEALCRGAECWPADVLVIRGFELTDFPSGGAPLKRPGSLAAQSEYDFSLQRRGLAENRGQSCVKKKGALINVPIHDIANHVQVINDYDIAPE